MHSDFNSKAHSNSGPHPPGVPRRSNRGLTENRCSHRREEHRTSGAREVQGAVQESHVGVVFGPEVSGCDRGHPRYLHGSHPVERDCWVIQRGFPISVDHPMISGKIYPMFSKFTIPSDPQCMKNDGVFIINA